MKAADIVKQLWLTLPRYTNLFSDDIVVSSLTRSGTTVTAVTATPHGLSNGNYVFISGAKTPITITSLTQVNGVATAITASNHDFTDDYTETVEINGADQAGYNGVHDFIHQPNRRTFTFKVDPTTVSPATGTIQVISNIKYGYNGLQLITVVNPTTFTYQITSTPESPAQGSMIMRSNIRITSAINFDRAVEAYTKQGENKLYAFVLLGNVSASKDRYTLNDSTATLAVGQDYRQRLIEPFSVCVFMPTTREIAGVNARDIMQDLAQPIFKSLLRFKFPSVFTDKTEFNLVFSGHQFIEYSLAYYVHEFQFENQFQIRFEDTVDDDDSVAFRDIDLHFNTDLNSVHNEIMHTNVDLDDVPI